MLCTNCHAEVKPVVAIDIDGTMGRYHEHFLRFAEQYFGEGVPWDYRGDGSFRNWFKKAYHVADDDWHDVKLAYRQGGMKRSMPVYPGAASLTTRAIELGAEVWVTTTRPYIRHDNIDPDTREWLRRNGIRYDYLLYDGDKYQKLRQLVGYERVVIVIDDLIEELSNAALCFMPEKLYMRENAFNSGTSWPQTISSLRDGQIIVDQKITEWRREYDPSAGK